MRRLALWALLAVLTVEPAVTEGDDDLFGDGQGDIVAPEGPAVDLSPLLAVAKPRWGGNITMSGAIYAGWSQLPDPKNLEANFDKGFGYDLKSGMTFDFRPDPTFHWSAALATAIPAGSVTWSAPSITTMYIDYTLLDRIFFTVGKFGLGWGVGRLFVVNDLVSTVADDFSMKAFGPLGPLGATVVMMLPGGATRLDQVQWATQAEGSLWSINVGLSSWYAPSAPPKVDLWAKTVLWGADIFAESKAVFGSARPELQALAGVYWEGFEPKLQLQVEWMADAPTWTWTDQSFAFACSWANIPGTSLKPSARVTQTLADWSGQLVLGLETDPFPHIHATLGLPISWGAPNSRWVAATLKAYHETWALALKVDVTGAF